MEKISFNKTSKVYDGRTDFLRKGIMVIEFESEMPSIDEISEGFNILNEYNYYVQAEYSS